jgi:dTDP-4-amino-4,6-dideoxygalactose transaminase
MPKQKQASADFRYATGAGIITPLLDDQQIKSTHHLYLLQVDPAKAGGEVQDLKEKLAARGLIQIPHFAPRYKFSLLRQLGYDTQAIEKTCPIAEEAFQHRFRASNEMKTRKGSCPCERSEAISHAADGDCFVAALLAMTYSGSFC